MTDSPRTDAWLMETDPVAKWKHRKGDEYAVILCRLIGNPEQGYGFVYHYGSEPFGTREQAQSAGFELNESDDFNIGVLRKGRLVAMLWMDEIMDSEATLMVDIEHCLETGARIQ